MLDIDTFKKLSIDKKSEYLESIFLSRIKHNDRLYNNLDTFLMWANETELIEMYEVIVNPDSIKDYVNTQCQKIKKWNQKMTDMMHLLKIDILKLKEEEEKNVMENQETDFDNILQNI